MRADLLHAQASVDWAIARIPLLDRSLNSWLSKNKKIFIEELPPPATNYVVLAGTKEPLPVKFIVEAGLCVNAIRSSLDILAVSLAYRFGVPDYEEASFPFAGSEALFDKRFKASKLKNGLPESERIKIENLKPYKGGNNFLWSLHHFDIVRKHRRLLEIQVDPSAVFINPTNGLDRNFIVPVNFEVRSADNKAVIGFFVKGKPQPQVDFAAAIAINEVGPFGGAHIIPTLNIFVGLANNIISQFDTA